MFASCLVRCTVPPVDFADQLPLPRLYSTPGRGFLMEVALCQVCTLLKFATLLRSLISSIILLGSRSNDVLYWPADTGYVTRPSHLMHLR